MHILRRFLIWLSPLLLVIATTVGPSLAKLGPFDLVIYDVFTILYLALFTLLLLTGGRINGKTVREGAPLYGYVFFITVLSITGIVIYHYGVRVISNEVRWIITILLFLIIGSVAPTIEARRSCLYRFFKILVVFYLTFMVLQIIHSVGGPTWGILEWWYQDYTDPTRPFGYNIGRYSGAAGGPSSLGSIGAVSGLWFWVQYTRREKKGDALFLLLSLFLLVGSGTRTSMVAFVVSFVFLLLLNKKAIKTRYIVYFGVAAGIVIIAAVWYDIGRFSSGRYAMLIEILAGELTYSEVSGRGQAWASVIERSSGVIGTLSNPSYVFEDVVVDSYYLHAYAQGGVLLVCVFFILTISPVYRYFKSGGTLRMYSVSVSIFVMMSCINQNFMTGNTGRIIILVMLISSSRSNYE